jgi:hypothetical protein
MREAKKTPRLVLTGVVTLVALVALLPGSPALADQPQFQSIPVDYAYTHQSECAFDVVEHGEGTIRWVYHPNSGNPVASVYHYDLRGTYTNVQTGSSVDWSEDTALKGYYQDGSLTLFFVGLAVRINVPGQGRVVADVGRLVLRYTQSNSDPEVIFEAGQWDGFSALCSALE